MCRLDCPGEEYDRMVGFYVNKIGPVVSVKAQNFFVGLSVQFSLRALYDHTWSFVNKLHTVCSEKSNRNSQYCKWNYCSVNLGRASCHVRWSKGE